MFLDCDRNVTGVLEICYRDVTIVLLGCYMGGIGMLNECYSIVTLLLHGFQRVLKWW